LSSANSPSPSRTYSPRTKFEESPELVGIFARDAGLDPKRPIPLVSSIAQAILSELERARGAKVLVTLVIDAEAANGFPEDVESVVRDNAKDLRLTDFGFESE
jgi:hypothetical protein